MSHSLTQREKFKRADGLAWKDFYAQQEEESGLGEPPPEGETIH